MIPLLKRYFNRASCDLPQAEFLQIVSPFFNPAAATTAADNAAATIAAWRSASETMYIGFAERLQRDRPDDVEALLRAVRQIEGLLPHRDLSSPRLSLPQTHLRVLASYHFRLAAAVDDLHALETANRVSVHALTQDGKASLYIETLDSGTTIYSRPGTDYARLAARLRRTQALMERFFAQYPMQPMTARDLRLYLKR